MRSTRRLRITRIRKRRKPDKGEMMDRSKLWQLISCAVVGAVFGALASSFILAQTSKSQDQLITEFYAAELAASISPASLAKALDQGTDPGTLVDLRSKSSFEAGHFKGAINIPAEELSPEQLFSAFSALPKNKPIITYCYSSYCMLSREAGNYLAGKGIYTKHLTAGWYEIQRDYPAYTEGSSANNGDTSTPNSVCRIDNKGFGC